jgi:4'-phosphopantetheinyl transferase EntD
VIERMLQCQVAAVEAFADVRDCELFPEEEAAVANAVDKRRREFTTARACARAALARLGEPPVPIVPGPQGAPRWPAGIVGSITHCHGYRAAAVARASDVLTLGLDAEPNEVLPDGVLDIIALDEERAQIAGLLSRHRGVCWDRLLFCAKESVYKAWFPVTRRWLGFEEASITIDPLGGTFSARLLADRSPFDSLHGRWLADRGLLATVIVVLAGSRAHRRAEDAEDEAITERQTADRKGDTRIRFD